ncbi:hypothetical protein JD969_17555 [Planctomycetota bacterium]|nr:hypothetical protein JD969_17555 [Planctomycetota bacterium]
MKFYVNHVQEHIAFIVVAFEQGDGVLEGYSAIADYVAENKLSIVHERIFGSLQNEKQALLARKEIFDGSGLDSSNTISWIEGMPIWGSGVAGIMLKAISPQHTQSGVQRIWLDGKVVGSKWQWDGDQYIILQGLGLHNSKIINDDRCRQTEEAISQAEALLYRENMAFKDVARTWFYLDDILDWYNEFNIVRNKIYNQFELMPQGETCLKLPASTGICGKNNKDSALLIDLVAVKKLEASNDNSIIKQLSNNAQEDAFEYGSAFSRGAVIAKNDFKILQLSGTASINEAGETIFINDPKAQIECTLDKIQNLLMQEDVSLADMGSACVFCKDATYANIYQEIAIERGLEEMPAILMVADVCRDDLLFEIDGECLKKSKQITLV